MKVTIVVGGRWHAFDLAKELYLKGCLHRLITNYPYFAVKKWGIPKEHIVSLPTTFFLVKAIYWLGGESLMMKCQWIVHSWFARQASKHLKGSELIHAWSSWAEPSFRWALINNVPTLLERSSAHILEQSQLLSDEFSRLQLHWTPTHRKIEAMECREYTLADKIAVPSLFVERSFLKRGFRPAKLARNCFGVNQSLFIPLKTQKRENTSGLSILYAGAISVQKGIHDLLEAFHAFNDSRALLTLLGGMTPQMKRLIDDSDVRVKLPGHRPQHELPHFYQQHDVFVMPSIQDGMAMVQLQALASGLPLICTTNTGGEDLLQMDGASAQIRLIAGEEVIEYSAGWVIPIHCPHVLHALFLQLSLDRSILVQKQSNALRLKQCGLTWKDYSERTLHTYQELLASQ